LLTPQGHFLQQKFPAELSIEIPPVFVHSLLPLRTCGGAVKRLCFNPAIGDVVGAVTPHVAALGSSLKFATPKIAKPDHAPWSHQIRTSLRNPMGHLTAANNAATYSK